MRDGNPKAIVRTGLVCVSLILPAAPPRAAGWELPLTVEEQQGVGGLRRITCGVPLLAGQAEDVGDLRLLPAGAGPEAAALPAQFRELARWWRDDNSIRWVLVDFAADIGAKQTNTFVLTNDGRRKAPASRLSVRQDENFITVETGPAKFVVNRKAFNFLQKAIVDLNGDGKLSDDEDLLAGSAECGSVMEDAFGQKYYGSEGATDVTVLEAGPMRVCVRARGKHPPRDGKGYSLGMYSYDVFLNFYADSSDVSADLVIGNNFQKPIGIPAFEDGSIVLKLAAGADGYRILGEKPEEGRLSAGESVCLYQDSNGADTWETCSGFGKMESSGWKKLPAQLTSFRGFKLVKRAGGKEDDIAAGDHARGSFAVWNRKGGVVAHVKNFWQQFPKASEAGADGTLRIGLWPREWKYPHFLTDCSAKGHEIVLHFFAAGGASRDYAADPAGRPLPESVADRWDARVFARPPAAHRAAAGALSDLGPYTIPTVGADKTPGSKLAIDSGRMLTDDELYGNAYGCRVFGERWRSQGGHGSRGARQPIDEDNFLWRWYVTGVPDWLALGDARSRQYRDVRCYRVDDQDALGFKDWASFRVANRSERREWANRVEPDNEEIRKYREGLPDYGTAWEFPNPEHCVLDLLYDRYLIFGDVRSLENMRVAAGHGGYFAVSHAPRPGADLPQIGGSLGRSNGWSWRTLERYWELTGDKRAGEMIAEVIKGYEPVIGKSPLWFANDRLAHASDWFTRIFTRAAAMTALHTGDPKALEICRSLAVGKEDPWAGSVTYGKQSQKDARQFSTLFAVLYHLTGEEKYREPLVKALSGDGLLTVGDYFTASDHWLLNQPPKVKIPVEGSK